MSGILRHLCFWLFAVCSLGNAAYASTQNVLPEYTLKAAFLYNFAVLTEWPEDSLSDRFEVCYFGNDAIGEALEAIRDKRINSRRINIRHLEAARDAKTCHLLFIGGIERFKMASIMDEIAQFPILTVTDNKAFSENGVAIFLRPEGQHLVFEIDAEAAKKVNLNISARLLRLAK